MFSPQRKLIIIMLLCGVIFAAGMVQLFLLRFEAGDIYPPYSSLRSDPLGTLALFDSINRVSGNTAERNYRPWHQVEFDQRTTLMVIGLDRENLRFRADKIEKLLDGVAENGGRVVMTFTADVMPRKEDSPTAADSEGSESGDTTEDRNPIEEYVEEEEIYGNDPSMDSMDAGIGKHPLGIKINAMGDELDEMFAVRNVDHPNFMSRTIPWRSRLHFQLQDSGWETLYTWQNKPVVVQRPWGRGQVVLLADSYLLSNEALRNHRSSGLLAWLVAPGHDILFDEYHKGMAKQPGIAGLTRKYRLHWVFAALLVVAVLFIWHQAAVFVPSVQAGQGDWDAPPTIGRDTSQGMVDLSRQHIGTEEILAVCFKAWRTQAAQHVSQPLVDDVRAIVLEATRDPRKEIQIESYKEICKLLKQGKRS